MADYSEKKAPVIGLVSQVHMMDVSKVGAAGSCAKQAGNEVVDSSLDLSLNVGDCGLNLLLDQVEEQGSVLLFDCCGI